jgi:hypothetical protein
VTWPPLVPSKKRKHSSSRAPTLLSLLPVARTLQLKASAMAASEPETCTLAIRGICAVNLADRRARPSPAVWGWGCLSPVRSSKLTAAGCGRPRICRAPSLNSPFLRAKILDRDWTIQSVRNLWFGERASPGCLYPIVFRQGGAPRLHASAGAISESPRQPLVLALGTQAPRLHRPEQKLKRLNER